MRRTRGFSALAVAITLWGCGGDSSSTSGGPPPPANCLVEFSACTKAAECCGTCSYGYCMPSLQGGQCASTNDCADPYLCVGYVCSAASCRQDLDVCADDTECCLGNCRGTGTCGANRPPVAVAGADAAVNKRQLVRLGGSTDPDGDPLTYAWTLTKPAGSAATLSSTSAAPSFVTDLVGTYVATVTVSDGQYSATASATFTAFNSPPVARVWAARTIPRNVAFPFTDYYSSDPDGDPITFAWSIAGPAGSTAALTSTADRATSFTPDLLGDYAITLTVSDGDLSSSATVVFTAVNTPPVPVLTVVTHVNAGESVTVSAASSTDQNGDPLTFTWTLQLPYGSAASLTATTGATTSFTTDAENFYTLTLSVSDGIDTRTAAKQVQAHPHLAKLSHDVVGAAYSKATNRLITISTTPANALWIMDPATELETRVDLAGGTPLSVGVSADGLVAVVGRNGGVTEIDLTAGTTITDCVTRWSDTVNSWNYDAASIAVGAPITLGNGGNARTTRFAYAAPGSAANRGDYTMGLDLGLCSQSADWILGMYFQGNAALRPDNGQFYVHDYYGETFYVYSMPSGVLSTRLTADVGWTAREGFWFFEDGTKFLVEGGAVYDSTPVTTVYGSTFPRLAELGNPPGPYDPRQLVLHADHSAVRTHLSIIPLNDFQETESDTVLKNYTGTNCAYTGRTLLLPPIVIDGGLNTAHGRYVFYRSDGSKRYVVIRTPPGAATELFAVATMVP